MQEAKREDVVNEIERAAEDEIAKYTAKDSVFTALFGENSNQLKLYRSLHPEDNEATEDDITDVTLRCVLTDGQYNDLGMRVGNRLILLLEHQSTWSMNILFRALMYLVQSYLNFFRNDKQDIYSTTKLRIPKPELYVVYTGERKDRPEVISFSKEFFGGESIAVDVEIKMVYGLPEYGDKPLKDDENILNQYVVFAKVYNEQIKKLGYTRMAVEETIRICKELNALKDFLASRESEVISIMMALYDEKEIMRMHVESKEFDAAVRATVEDCIDFGVSFDDTVNRVVKKYGISINSARDKVDEYWTVIST